MARQDGAGEWGPLGKIVRHLGATLAALFVYSLVFIVVLTATMYGIGADWWLFAGALMGILLLIFILPVIAILTQIGAFILSRFPGREPGRNEIITIVIAGVIAGGLPAYGVGFIFERGIVPFGLPGMIAGAAAALVLRWGRGRANQIGVIAPPSA